MDFMKTLHEVAYETFALKTGYFDRLSSAEWANMGIENWVQVELVLALLIRDFHVITKGKVARQCDLIIDDKHDRSIGVELRCSTYPNAKIFLSAIEEHAEADYYLFLTKTNDKFLGELESQLKEKGYIEMHRELNKQWMVMVARKSAVVD